MACSTLSTVCLETGSFVSVLFCIWRVFIISNCADKYLYTALQNVFLHFVAVKQVNKVRIGFMVYMIEMVASTYQSYEHSWLGIARLEMRCERYERSLDVQSDSIGIHE